MLSGLYKPQVQGLALEMRCLQESIVDDLLVALCEGPAFSLETVV